MRTICITDPGLPYKTETFLDGCVTVLSRSGLHAAERLLIERLTDLAEPPARLLIAGNRTGVTALIASQLFPACEIVCHTFDIHYARTIEWNLLANGTPARLVYDEGVTLFSMKSPPTLQRPSADKSVIVACTSAVPPGPYDAALMMFTHGVMTVELVIDQLEEIHNNLREDGLFIMAAESVSAPLFKQYQAVFGGFTVHRNKKGLSCVSMRKKGDLKKPRVFAASFPVSLPGAMPITLVSLPGVFCHRRPDAGGLALAEIARGELKPNLSILDMGCGCGLVGCLLATIEPSCRVTFLDSHARALAATARNIQRLGLQNSSLVLADEGYVKGGFDLFVGNPPYYSDYKITDVFLETAFATLHRGGVCLTVAKTARMLEKHQRARFGVVELFPRRGYQILKSIRAARPAEKAS